MDLTKRKVRNVIKMSNVLPRQWVDYIGFGASFICAIHCILTPFLVMMLPVIGSYFMYSHEVEILFVICTLILAFFSICWGYRLHKENQLFLYLAVATFFLLIGEGFFHRGFYGFILTAIGGIMLAIVHYLNLKLCKSCNHC